MGERQNPQGTHTMHILALSATCNGKFPKRSPIAITGPMALELLGARDLDLVAHPFVIVHVYGVAGG